MRLLHVVGGSLLTPPGIVLVFLILGFLIRSFRPGIGRLFLFLGTVILLAGSLPFVSASLMRTLETAPAVRVPATGPEAPQAIVVLGGGRNADAPEYGGDTVGINTLVRLRYCAKLWRMTHLPVLVSGGTVFGSGPPESTLMATSLKDDFSVPVAWQESRSPDTWENAQDTARLLRAQHITRIYLVTQAWHMPRAELAFQRAGLIAVPAPTDFTSDKLPPNPVLSWLPEAGALSQTATALHEYIGMLWYELGGH